MEEQYIINIENCIADYSRPAVIRNLFVDIRDRGYVTVGDFFERMNDSDLDVLRVISETVADLDGDEPSNEQEEDAFSDLVMLSLGLTIAEGITIDPDQLNTNMRVTMSFIALEYLARANEINVYHENWSMDPDHSGIIADMKK